MNWKAVKCLRAGNPLAIHTDYGVVSLSSAACVWGEGANVTGLRFVDSDIETLSDQEGIALFGIMGWEGVQFTVTEWAREERGQDAS